MWKERERAHIQVEWTAGRRWLPPPSPTTAAGWCCRLVVSCSTYIMLQFINLPLPTHLTAAAGVAEIASFIAFMHGSYVTSEKCLDSPFLCDCPSLFFLQFFFLLFSLPSHRLISILVMHLGINWTAPAHIFYWLVRLSTVRRSTMNVGGRLVILRLKWLDSTCLCLAAH